MHSQMSLNIEYSTGNGKLVKHQSPSIFNFCITSMAYSLLFQSGQMTKLQALEKKKSTQKINNFINF